MLRPSSAVAAAPSARRARRARRRLTRVTRTPQASGFPFNLGIRHPQYVGSVATVWALVLLLWAPAARPALAQVGAAWTALYVVTGIIEDKTKGG